MHKTISCKRKVVVHAILFWVALLYWDIKGRWNLEYTLISQMSTLVEKKCKTYIVASWAFQSPIYSTKLTTEQNDYPCIAFAIFERAELGNRYLLVFLFPSRQWIADRLESVHLSGWLSLGASCRWCYRKQQGQRGLKRTRLYSTAATDLLGFSYAMATCLIWDPYVVERREQNDGVELVPATANGCPLVHGCLLLGILLICYSWKFLSLSSQLRPWRSNERGHRWEVTHRVLYTSLYSGLYRSRRDISQHQKRIFVAFLPFFLVWGEK